MKRLRGVLNRRQRQRRFAGFTLIDLVIAITVLSIGLATVLTTLATIWQRQIFNESMLNAAMMAQAVMDRALNKGFTNVNTLVGTGVTYDATNYANYTYDLNVGYVNVTDLNTLVGGPTNYKRVEVIVYYTLGGVARQRAVVRTIMTSG